MARFPGGLPIQNVQPTNIQLGPRIQQMQPPRLLNMQIRPGIQQFQSPQPNNMQIRPGMQSSQPNTSTRLNQYMKIAGIGQGGFGKCFKVQRFFAIKEITLQPTSDQKGFENSVLNEVETLKSLKHENIVPYLEAYVENSVLFIVMEYCPNGDLQNMLSQYPVLDIKTVMQWFTQLCLALQHVHSKDIIHRNVKPTNIFLTDSWKIKLGDFGIANILKRSLASSVGSSSQLSTRRGFPASSAGSSFQISTKGCGAYPAFVAKVCGTKGYMAPEYYREEYDSKVDVWGAGIVLWELTKNVNWTNQLPGVKQFVSDGVQDVLNQMLETYPADRAAVEDILNHPFVTSFQQ